MTLCSMFWSLWFGGGGCGGGGGGWGVGVGGFIRFLTFPILILRDIVLHIAYCFGHPSDMSLHLPGLSARQFVMLSIVFNSVLVQSSCHDSS